MKLTEAYVSIPGPGAGEQIRAAVIRPVGEEPWPGLVFYSDIFQLTESTLRCARRFASAGYVVCVPEIYPHGPLAGVALAFDDEGKRLGQEGADTTSTASFDADISTVLGYVGGREDVAGALRVVGFCTGGHLAFRAALDPRVAATACYYPTGLHDGRLGSDKAESLAAAGTIAGSLFIVYGLADPHTDRSARSQVFAALAPYDVEWHVVPGEHAFMRDEGPRYDPALTDEVLAAGLRFFAAAPR